MDIRKVFADIEKELDKVVYDIWDDAIEIKDNPALVHNGFIRTKDCSKESFLIGVRDLCNSVDFMGEEISLNRFYFDTRTNPGSMYTAIEIRDTAVCEPFEKELIYEFTKNYTEKPAKAVE